ncbi:MAG: SLATT domain-containing protein, partial [bacterium]
NVLLGIGSLSTAVGLALAIFQLSFNPEEKAYKYKQSANQLWQIREKYSCLIADIMSEKIKEEDVKNKRDDLLKELDMVYKNSLPTSSKAYKLASNALKVNEEFTFSTKEINKFLPKDLWLEE